MSELLGLFEKGGVLMWILLAISVTALAVFLERCVVYLSYGLHPMRWLDGTMELVRAGRVEEALRRARMCRHPVAKIVEEYLARLPCSRKVRMENVRQRGNLLMEQVEKRLRVLAAIAHLAPLVGLLGTVSGMVVAFARIQELQGAARPADLAGGIWEALLTTVFGLGIAIPSMAAFHAFESHADRIIRRMELAVTQLENQFGGDGGGENGVFLPQESPQEEWTSIG